MNCIFALIILAILARRQGIKLYQLRKYYPVIPVPQIGGAVQAGFPSPAMDYVEDAISLDRQFI